MTDRVTIHGLEVWARHGVLPEERSDGQPFVVDVTVHLDVAEAATGDDLTATVDYSVLSREVAVAAVGEPCHLIETVAERIARAVLTHPEVEAVEVTVSKPHAPLPVPARGVSVTIRRTRER